MKLNFNEKKKILILCTGNSCRSQMAEGFARKSGWLAFSAGIKPEIKVNPFAVKVMDEVNIDISNHIPQAIDDYLSDEFYLIVTVCDNAQKYCPTFTGNYIHQIHHSFQDPVNATGTHEDIMNVYRKIRDEIQIWMKKMNEEYLA